MASRRQFPELPTRKELREAALVYIEGTSCYLARDLKAFLIQTFEIPSEYLALRFRSGRFAFENYVDWVTAEFTKERIHTGPSGGRHKNASEPYFLTPYGMEAARLAMIEAER